MKPGAILLLLLTIMPQALYAQTNGLTLAQQSAVLQLVHAAKTGNKQQIASRVAYPLKRIYPLGDIKNKAAMLDRFDVVFDGKLLKPLARSGAGDWTAMGWRGAMLGNGVLWMDDAGNITAVNHQSEKEKRLLENAIREDRQQLPPSLRSFDKPLYSIITNHYRIRIDESAGDQLRYASWGLQRGKKEPDLVLYNGVYEAQGSGGNHTISFTNDVYRYVVAVNRLGSSETPEVLLTVYKNEKILLNDAGKIIRH
ncbi:hypothetical protein [Niabella drilacis]|uniref:Uncharacterized protein n=1 Tax=Niabella drilacis (strain DSM 25811 / CCM 8410 / CCUG 62505 / LMG 26954 / E90) TaxID=1285928 RepID=A0A1G6HZ43_NIADE|nr:hypothetical protein [Niabella drilacis]SDB99577.1 hypothetical protein SAMN04487894_10135 [Niabella drilacis]